MNSPRIASIVVTVVILFGGFRHALAQTPSFSWFGPANTEPYAVSADGIATTGRFNPGNGSRAFRWTSAGGMLNLGLLYGNHDSSQGFGISGDGSVIVGVSGQGGTAGIGTTRGFKWSSGGMSDLGTLAGHNYSVADDVSADGSVIVGVSGVQTMVTTTFRAVMWNPGIQNLGVLPGTFYSHAYGISDDGSTVVGFSSGPGISIPFRWRSGTGMQSLGPGIGTALAASADGSVVVGDVNAQAFRWTEASGMQQLGVLPGHLYGSATGVSADGSVVVGFCSGGGQTTAFRWVVGGQMQSVGNLLVGHGIWVDACWACSYARGVSADGMTLVGEGCYPADGSQGCAGWIATIPLDSDGDGLLDPWESQSGGIDGDGNGTIDLNLYELGARPDHKDLFVELDAMSPRVTLSPLAQSMLFNAFSFSPIEGNPDGIGGITLHIIDAGVDAIPFEEVWYTDAGGCWPVNFAATKSVHFGSPSGGGDSQAVKDAKAKAFRYCIAVNKVTNPKTGGGIGGCGEMPGNDFVIAIGGYSDESAAAVFMHELGHTLSLDHGGSDGVNGKPNYVSLMNYALSYRSNFSDDFWRLDYSRLELDPLVESDLDETLGVAAPEGYGDTNVYMPYGCDEEDPKGNIVRMMHYFRLDSSPVDWDRDGVLNRNGGDVANNDINYAGPSAPVGGLNTPAPNEVLASFDDWANIELPIPGATALTGAPKYPTNEPPPAPVLVAWLNANVPTPCLADLNTDQTVNVDDLLAVINAWGACANCAADINNDNTVNVDDLLAVINAWGPCP